MIYCNLRERSEKLYEKRRMTNPQQTLVYNEFWMLKTAKEAAEDVGVTLQTVYNMWDTTPMRGFYRDGPIPTKLFLDAVSECGNEIIHSLSKKRKPSKEALKGYRLRMRFANERLQVLLELTEYKNIMSMKQELE